ncbi:MAG: GIY-YIG nuclease family protein [Oscillospiraceae bacterium]
MEYVLYNDLVDEKSKLCKGSTTRSGFIKKHELKKNKYTYARKSKGKWRELGFTDKNIDKLFLLKGWFDTKVCKKAPKILDLKNSEQFRDFLGDVMNFEARGERNYDKCYFRVKDVSRELESPSLETTLLDKSSNYEEQVDYVYLLCKTPKGKRRELMFLTYRGIIKVIFATKNIKTEQFVDWVAEMMFTIQMGSTKQKDELAKKLLGSRVVTEVLNLAVSGTSAIYLVKIGTVSELREKLNISKEHDDSKLVLKFGCTKDLGNRIRELKYEYKDILTNDIELVCFGKINPILIFRAERALRSLFINLRCRLKHKSYRELIMADDDKEFFIQEYGKISDKHSTLDGGRYQELEKVKKKLTKSEEKCKKLSEEKKNIRAHMEKMYLGFTGKELPADARYISIERKQNGDLCDVKIILK